MDFSGGGFLGRAALEALQGGLNVLFGQPWDDVPPARPQTPTPAQEPARERPAGPTCDRCGGDCWDSGECTWCGYTDLENGCLCTIGHLDMIPTPGPRWDGDDDWRRP